MKVKVWMLLGLLFIVIVVLSAANAVHAVEVIATVPVGTGPWGVAYDSGKGEIFVANHYDNTVSVISDSSNTVVATIPVGIEPVGVAYDSGKGVIFCSGSNGHNVTVWVMSDDTYAIVANLTLGRGSSYDVVYDSATGEVFVPDGRGAVYVISDSSLPSPSPTVPEFTPGAILILATTTCIIVIAFRKKH